MDALNATESLGRVSEEPKTRESEITDRNVERWSLEIVSRYAGQLHLLLDSIEEVYITMIPESDPADVLEATRVVRDSGRYAVPHLAARNLIDEEQLRGLLSEFQDLGVDRVLLIAGGHCAPRGQFSSVMDMLNTGAFQQHGIFSIGVAGHPEGNPDDPECDFSLLKKIRWAETNGVEMRIVSQWSFDSSAVNEWIWRLRQQGIENPVHIGVAGPATMKSLMHYAKVCGVKASSSVLKKQGFNLSKLLFINKPDVMVSELKGYDQLHLFPFGGLSKASEWLNERGAGNNL